MSSHDEMGERFAEILHHLRGVIRPGDPVTPQITPAAVFHLPGDPGNAPYQYGRFNNPTWRMAEDQLGALDNAEAVAFPSGMAALSAVLFSHVAKGDRILLPADGYYTTRLIAERYLAPLGVVTETRPTASMGEGALDGFKLVLMESPSNPGLDVCDIADIAARAKKGGALVFADATTLTPLGLRPLELGCDAVIHAGTKAINGHSDVLFGHVASRDGALIQRLRDWRRITGPTPSVFDAFLVMRGLETLELRFARAAENARVIAERLAGHPKLKALRYPGLASDPAHAIARKQQASFGSLMALTFRDARAANLFIEECRLLQASTSFGGVRTSAERRARWGDAVPEGFVRLACGIEPTEPLWRAIKEAIDRV
ncbi:MAG TPA: cystathionine gamma-lyase [Micropepsaceae bacterium]|nr:cystathionine gamma-lyase [Micropepsaceae bacterium]